MVNDKGSFTNNRTFRASLAFTLRATYLGDVLRRRSGLRHQPLHHHNLKDEAEKEKVNIM